jgi:RHS repeat-associated protein
LAAKTHHRHVLVSPDHLGSTSWVTDQNGKVHEHVEYYPYGEVWWEPRYDRDGAPVKGQQFLFTSKEFDEETGLYYFGARYYDAKRVRWESADPLALTQATPQEEGKAASSNEAPRAWRIRWPRALNVYAYVGWAPLSCDDPDGLAERGDVVFFNWHEPKPVDWPRHAAIVTQVDASGNPTHAFGAWEDTMKFHEVDLSKYHGGITGNIIGTGSMAGLTSMSVDDLMKKWNGTDVAANWGEHGEPGPVCVDIATAPLSLGGAKLRSAMDKDLGQHPGTYKELAKKYGMPQAKAGKDSLYRQNPYLKQFFMDTKRYTDTRKKRP